MSVSCRYSFVIPLPGASAELAARALDQVRDYAQFGKWQREKRSYEQAFPHEEAVRQAGKDPNLARNVLKRMPLHLAGEPGWQEDPEMDREEREAACEVLAACGADPWAEDADGLLPTLPPHLSHDHTPRASAAGRPAPVAAMTL